MNTDLISRENLKKEVTEKVNFTTVDGHIAYDKMLNLIDNAPTVESFMKDKIKQAVADEFKYRASQGRTNYSMEEVIYIVCEVIDEVAFEENEAEPQDQTPNLDMQMCVIKGDLRYLAEKVNKLSSLLEGQKNRGDKAVQNEH